MTLKLIDTLQCEDNVNHCRFNAVGSRMALAIGGIFPDTNSIVVYDVASRERLYTLEGHENAVSDCCFTLDATALISSSWDNDLIEWDLASHIVRQRFIGHEDSINWCLLLDDQQTIISGSWDSTIRFWNRENAQLLKTISIHQNYVNEGSLSRDQQYLVSCSGDGTALVWDMHGSLNEPYRTFFVNEELFSACFVDYESNSWLVTGGDSSGIRVWDIKSGNLIRTIDAGKDIRSITYNYSSCLIIAGTASGEILVYEPFSFNVIFSLEAHGGVIFSMTCDPKEQLLATTASDWSCKIWEIL